MPPGRTTPVETDQTILEVDLMTHRMGGRPLLLRGFLALIVLLAGILALQASAASAATQVYTGQDDGPTPDIYRSDIDEFFYPDGSSATPPVGQAGTINLTIDGTPVVAFCVDSRRGLSTGTIEAGVTEVPLDSVPARAILYVLQTSAPTGAPTPAKQNQAAVGQTATWVLDGDLREDGPTSDAAFNAEVAALVAAARAAAATPASLGITASAPAAGATNATITVTGRPGAVVTLSVTAGSGALSASQVTIGPSGSATATLTSAGPGAITVGASTPGDGRLFRTAPVNDSQATVYAVPSTLSASAAATFAAGTPGTTPGTTPGGGTSGAPAKLNLTITKAAPARAQVLRLVRYRITVRNTTKRTATSVVIRDRVPGGLTFVRASRTASIRNGAVVVRLGNLAPGASRTISVWMRATANVRGARVNTVTVSGANVRNRSATARTTFRPLAARVQPAVTG
jgi:uncharacterized repeat protein (TIGR01451 family)